MAEGGFHIRVGDEEERGRFQVNGSVGGGEEAGDSPSVRFGGIFLREDRGRRGEEGGEWVRHGDLSFKGEGDGGLNAKAGGGGVCIINK